MWTRSLKLRCRRVGEYSLPVGLADGRVLLTANRRLVEEVEGRLKVLTRVVPDDSGPSPNVAPEGVYVGGQFCMVRWNGAALEELGPNCGYDILPPAFFSNGDFGMASYYGEGLCRVESGGSLVWAAPPHQLDTLVVINQRDEVACSSLNDNCSVVVGAYGRELWRINVRAHFSCCPDGGWVALSRGKIRRLDPAGRDLWTRAAEVEPDWGLQQAVVDDRGWVYAPCRTGLTAWDEEGRPVFQTSLPDGSPSGLCPVAPGLLALIHAGRLVLVE